MRAERTEFAGYSGFGSFMVERSVEDLVNEASDGAYNEPPWPTPSLDTSAILASLSAPLSKTAPFGAPFRANFFLDPTWTFINHGAFGAAARVSLAAAQRWREHCEAQPLRFLDRQLFPELVRVQARLAALMHCRAADLALVPNATTALNAAVSAAGLRAGDVAFMLDIGYGSVKTMVRIACVAAGATLHIAPLTWPLASISDVTVQARQALAAAAAAAAASGGRLALAVFDAVTSNTALVLPVADLVAAARAAGAVRVLVDGAHAPGTLDADLPASGADWYVGNAHKWLCAGKGVGFLYAASPAVRAVTHSPVLSHGRDAGFASEFSWDGCRDYGGALALPALLEWWDAVGGLPRARLYCRTLLSEAVASLTARWGTRAHAPPDCYAQMACVELPARALPRNAVPQGDAPDAPCAATSAHAKAVQDRLFAARVEVPVKCLPGAGCAGGDNMRLYVRVSAAVYNDRADYERLADAVEALRWDSAATV